MRSRLTLTFASTLASLCFFAAPNTASAAIQLSALMNVDAIYTSPQGGFLLILPASNPACGSSGNQFNVTGGKSE